MIAADQQVQELAERLREVELPLDNTARFGGEAFTALARVALAFAAEQQPAPPTGLSDEGLALELRRAAYAATGTPGDQLPAGLDDAEEFWLAVARRARELLPQPARCTERELAEVIGRAPMPPNWDLDARYKAQARAAAARLGVPLAPEPQQASPGQQVQELPRLSQEEWRREFLGSFSPPEPHSTVAELRTRLARVIEVASTPGGDEVEKLRRRCEWAAKLLESDLPNLAAVLRGEKPIPEDADQPGKRTGTLRTGEVEGC